MKILKIIVPFLVLSVSALASPYLINERLNAESVAPVVTPIEVEVPVEVPVDVEAPSGAIEITGLLAGTTDAVAHHNSKVLNDALSGGGKNLILPINVGKAPTDFDGKYMQGYWTTWEKIYVWGDTTLTFNGGIMQSENTPGDQEEGNVVRTLDIAAGNVILNNPLISQGGFIRTARSGTHATLGIYGSYNKGNITINGGIIEGGASNSFQGGRNNTTFNGTVFRNSREHLVYAHGINGNGTKTGDADGLTFNDCIMENPGINHEVGQYVGSTHEANHIQLRHYKNVTINKSIVQGIPETVDGQFGVLITDVHGLLIKDTTFTGNRGLMYAGLGSTDIHFDNVWNENDRTYYIMKTDNPSIGATFDNCYFDRPLGAYGTNVFNNSTFNVLSYRFLARENTDLTFNNTTWDVTNARPVLIFLDESGKGSSMFTGSTTKVNPDSIDVNWGIIPN